MLALAATNWVSSLWGRPVQPLDERPVGPQCVHKGVQYQRLAEDAAELADHGGVLPAIEHTQESVDGAGEHSLGMCRTFPNTPGRNGP